MLTGRLVERLWVGSEVCGPLALPRMSKVTRTCMSGPPYENWFCIWSFWSIFASWHWEIHQQPIFTLPMFCNLCFSMNRAMTALRLIQSPKSKISGRTPKNHCWTDCTGKIGIMVTRFRIIIAVSSFLKINFWVFLVCVRFRVGNF